MNLDFVNDQQSVIPTPLSFKRNGSSEVDQNKIKKYYPDTNKDGKYFGASMRMGPFMSVQEDRVSK